jgi:hypothetical protein
MQNTSGAAVTSRNTERGFFGTVRPHANAAKAWAAASAAVARATRCSNEAIRGFLDSRYGREFAESVIVAVTRGEPLHDAIDQAVEHWMDRRTNGHIESELGIPRGLPCLIAFVRMHEALHEIGDRAFLDSASGPARGALTPKQMTH